MMIMIELSDLEEVGIFSSLTSPMFRVGDVSYPSTSCLCVPASSRSSDKCMETAGPISPVFPTQIETADVVADGLIR